eukprot:TRINITY_DN5964_c0_g4_i1.p1 TRINITY_DN5964_c0_g4~~TRINITY_DN5964_c0_g4_i1.p1  ORF type:complete len:483 (-),score=43.10 TRINITY_DN5964_c0_g4_i1:170-1618(-)
MRKRLRFESFSIEHPDGPVGEEYPVGLAFAIIIGGGYVFKRLFLFIGLPGQVGIMLSGFLFMRFLPNEDILLFRDQLQELSFFLVLCMIGLEIKVTELKPMVLLFSWMPIICEVSGIAIVCNHMLHANFLESLTLGCVVSSVGDGLVIPAMMEFKRQYPGHPLPGFVFTQCALECTLALTAFGVVKAFVADSYAHLSGGAIVGFRALNVMSSLILGAVLGVVTATLIPKMPGIEVAGKRMFEGTPLESFMMFIVVALTAFGAGVVLNPFGPGHLFGNETTVISCGAFFALYSEHDMLHRMEKYMQALWAVGQLTLFSMLGSRQEWKSVENLPSIFPIIGVGLVSRIIGVALGVSLTAKSRGSPPSVLLQEMLFCLLSCLPRATIQGALGMLPLKMHLFAADGDRGEQMRKFIFVCAKSYIVFFAVVGTLLLNVVGPRLLSSTHASYPDAQNPEAEIKDQAPTESESRKSEQFEDCHETDSKS